MISRQDSNSSTGSCSTHPGRGYICLISRLTVHNGAPVPSISIPVVPVVPWSNATMYPDSFMPTPHSLPALQEWP